MPITTSADSGVVGINNIVAFANPGTTTGNNLVAVWYTREGTVWSPLSWETHDRWAIVEKVKETLGIPNADDFMWGVDAEPGGTVVGNPIAMSMGLLADDPLEEAVASASDPGMLVTLLVSVGHAAAKTPVDNEDAGCQTSGVLSQIAEAILPEAELVDPSTTAVALRLAASFAPTCMGGTQYVPISTKPMGLPQPWVLQDCIDAEDLTRPGWWHTHCYWKRTQNFLRRRTVSCVIGGAYVFCDQSAILTCWDEQHCDGPSLPGIILPEGTIPPTPRPPAPTMPCGPTPPRDIILIPGPYDWDDYSVPANCDDNGWFPANCACPS